MTAKTFLLMLSIVTGFCACKEQPTEQDFPTISYPESTSDDDESGLFNQLDPTTTGITFHNTLLESEQVNFLTYEYLNNGGGVAAGDINNDGLMDLYFVSNMEANRLYLNDGNFKFRDITTSAGADGGVGYKTGVTMADINQDGFLDIYVCKSMYSDSQYRKNVLYINNGDLTFTERSKEYGIDDASYSTQAYFFDMDTDGDLDLYLLNHPPQMGEANNINLTYNDKGELILVKPTDLTHVTDRLYENIGNRFRDITQTAGIENEAFGLSVVVGDFNDDLRPDMYVCNDYVKPDYLYINNGDKTFTEKFSEYFSHSSFSSMGSDFADINNDGCLDLITLDMLPRDHYRQNTLGMAQNFDKFQKMISYGLKAQYSMNALQLNNCDGTFSDIAFFSNTAYTDWSWSALFADFDNDGWKDIYVTNGYRRDVTNNDYSRFTMDSLRKAYQDHKTNLVEWVRSIPTVRVKSYLFKNDRNLHFKDVSEQWNSGAAAYSSGAVYADLDNDGYLDIVVSNLEEPPFVLQNTGKTSKANNFVRFLLEDTKPAYGTRIRIYTGETQFQDQVYYPTRGFLSNVEPIVHFGVGKSSSIRYAEIIWPDGNIQTLESPAINTLHRVTKSSSGNTYKPKAVKNIFVEDISNILPREAAHRENIYIDFKREPLLHHKYSEEGPATAVGDVNQDGLDDIYLGGAAGFSGKLLIQQRNGSFIPQLVNDIERDSLYEDVAALFFDANSDGFQDLLVVSGGNEQQLHAPLYLDRLYMNDGKGELKRSEALPKQYSSGGCIAAADIDQDGDIDLFIGARISPGKYPTPPTSNLLRNDNGRFTNVTTEWSEGLINLGMLTDARFADLDKDGSLELIIAGEWMPVTIFKKVNNKYINATADFGLSDLSGWWYSLEIADLNNDGFPDIVAGNLGLNSHIQASKEKPATLHYKDFDHNGTIDPILCFYNRDKSYPLHLRDRLLDHMIILKKKFTRYHMYANATLEDILTPEQLKDARVLTANTFAHTLFINQGGKTFAPQVLPRYTQISTVRAIKAMDVNHDGMTDLVIGGNLYVTDAQFGRYDASVGAILIGDGHGDFQVVGPADSGFSIPGNVRSILPIKTAAGTSLFVARNNDVSSLFVLK